MQRAFGGQLAALLVVLLHRGAGRLNTSKIDVRPFLSRSVDASLMRLDEVLGEHGRVFLRG